jgi:hypothetical protein
LGVEPLQGIDAGGDREPLTLEAFASEVGRRGRDAFAVAQVGPRGVAPDSSLDGASVESGVIDRRRSPEIEGRAHD